MRKEHMRLVSAFVGGGFGSGLQPLGFLLGISRRFTAAFDPLIQILRPVSPLAWLPLGLASMP